MLINCDTAPPSPKSQSPAFVPEWYWIKKMWQSVELQAGLPHSSQTGKGVWVYNPSRLFCKLSCTCLFSTIPTLPGFFTHFYTDITLSATWSPWFLFYSNCFFSRIHLRSFYPFSWQGSKRGGNEGKKGAQGRLGNPQLNNFILTVEIS